MMIKKIAKQLFTKKAALAELPGIQAQDDFARVLDRERGRSDRNSHGFSLVIYNVGANSGKNREIVGVLAEALVKRTRATDEAGWIDKERIGVLLPETYAEGARIFASHISEEFETREMTPPPCTIRTYPTQKGHGGGRRKTDKANTAEEAQSPAEIKEAVAGRSAETIEPQNKVEAKEEEDAVFLVRSLCALRMPFWKRAMDVAGAAFGILLVSPVLIFMAVFIKIVSPGPIFFRQERVGYLGRRFTMWKFRTMHVNNDVTKHQQYLKELIGGQAEDKPMVKQEDNPAIIPFGKYLRAASVDELPQLFNVLFGDMSLVGPRPPIPYEAEEYLRWHANRFETVPGMTGLWQVSGKNRLTFKEMIRLDIRYARNTSLWGDARILLKTFPVVIEMLMEKIDRKRAKESVANAGDNSRVQEIA
jgi:lipopolysaccharide/colanic/teichoic acid biosynthesis glycosyltransferase